MSEEWRIYPCTIDENRGYIMLDVAVAETIAKLPNALAIVRLDFKNPERGDLPVPEENDAVCVIEERIEEFTRQKSDGYVGRVTSAGQRRFYIYTRRDAEAWSQFVRKLGAETGYALQAAVSNDPSHQKYWNDLYPSEDDWRVINDMSVLDNLRENGDVETAVRQFDHWIYFDGESTARQFIDWATKDRFTLDTETTGLAEDGRYGVRLRHNGTAVLNDVTSHTLALNRKAEELGGDYDGWETFVIRGGS